MRARLESKTDETFRQELEKLYREKNQKIYRAAYGVTGNRQDAKDALQNVFLRLLRGRHPAISRRIPRDICAGRESMKPGVSAGVKSGRNWRTWMSTTWTSR